MSSGKGKEQQRELHPWAHLVTTSHLNTPRGAEIALLDSSRALKEMVAYSTASAFPGELENGNFSALGPVSRSWFVIGVVGRKPGSAHSSVLRGQNPHYFLLPNSPKVCCCLSMESP